MAQKFANAARAVLATGIVAGDTTVTIVSGGALFPAIISPDFARAVLQDESGIEIVLITAHTASATSFTVTRAQEGTTARSFAAGSVFGIRVTAADMDEALDAVDLATEVTGTLPVANGGTGSASLASNNVLLGNGTSALQAVAPGSSGNVLTSNGTTWTSAAPAVTLTGSETLSNKTISADNNTLSGLAASSFVLSNASGNIDGTAAQKAIPSGVVVGTTDTQTLTNKTLSGAVLNDGYTEEVFAVTGTTPALSPTNGSIQTWTLTANSTPTAGTWAAGQSITMMINDTASLFQVLWTSVPVTWVGGSAPTLAPASGNTVITLWKVGTTIYGALVGQVA